MLPLRCESSGSVRDPPRRKVWATTGAPKLLVIGQYRMGFELSPQASVSMLRVLIEYALPERAPARWLARLFGRCHARWCTRQMVDDAVEHFASRPAAQLPTRTFPREQNMRKPMRTVTAALTVAWAVSLAGCGYNTFQTTDEQVKAGWAEVINPYQRRADLISNLVNTVKGEAKFEQDTLTKVIEARAKATSIAKPPAVGFDTAPAKPAGPGSGVSK